MLGSGLVKQSRLLLNRLHLLAGVGDGAGDVAWMRRGAAQITAMRESAEVIRRKGGGSGYPIFSA